MNATTYNNQPWYDEETIGRLLGFAADPAKRIRTLAGRYAKQLQGLCTDLYVDRGPHCPKLVRHWSAEGLRQMAELVGRSIDLGTPPSGPLTPPTTSATPSSLAVRLDHLEHRLDLLTAAVSLSVTPPGLASASRSDDKYSSAKLHMSH